MGLSLLHHKTEGRKIRLQRGRNETIFALNNVKQGIFDLSTTLYGITFQRNQDIQVYHEDVEAYEVFDDDLSFLGVLYMDFFPREGKRAGAWNTNYRSQKIRNGNNIRPLLPL